MLIAVAAIGALFCFKGMEELIRNGRIKNNEAYQENGAVGGD